MLKCVDPPSTGLASGFLRVCLIFLAMAGAPLRAAVEVLDHENAPPPGLLSSRQVPERPASGIRDESGGLSTDAATELTRAHAAAAEAGIDIHTLILESPPQIDPTVFGTELVQRWTRPVSAIGAVVLSLPPVGSEPLVFINSRLAEKATDEELSALGRSALENAASLEGTEPLAYAATIALAKGLMETLARVRNVAAPAATAPIGDAAAPAAPPTIPNGATTPSSGEAKPPASRLDLYMAAMGPQLRTVLRYLALGIGACVILGFLLFIRHRRRPRLFPQVEYRHRFSAPYSGGNNARVSFARADLETPASHAQ